MIKLIIGNKGAGKTKKLIDLVNSCVENSDGNICRFPAGNSDGKVCI